MANKIVDNRLHVKHDLSHADQRNTQFFRQPSRCAHLGSQLLLYEHVVIPTNDFAIIPALIQWLGQNHFEAALDCGSISFLHRSGLLGYVGNGNGISNLVIKDNPSNPFLWWQKALFGEMAEAIELQLIHGVPSLTKLQRDVLLRIIETNSQSVTYENDFFIKNIAQESYRDVLDTPELISYVTSLVSPAGHLIGHPIDLLRLVEPDKVQFAGEGKALNAADLLVRIAEINMEVLLADLSGGADLLVSEGTEKILKNKLMGKLAVVPEGFARLLELNGIPDTRIAIESGTITLQDIWLLRQKKFAIKFRHWLNNAEPENSRDLERLYVESLGNTSLVQSLPVRIVRFALTTLVGAVEPISGTTYGIIDSFFVEKYLAGYRPKLMIDETKKLLLPNGKSLRTQ